MGLRTGIVKKKGRRLPSGRITIKKGTTIKGLLEKGLLSKKIKWLTKRKVCHYWFALVPFSFSTYSDP